MGECCVNVPQEIGWLLVLRACLAMTSARSKILRRASSKLKIDLEMACNCEGVTLVIREMLAGSPAGMVTSFGRG